jgi:hypothetical protein
VRNVRNVSEYSGDGQDATHTELDFPLALLARPRL